MLRSAPLLERLPTPLQGSVRELGASCRDLLGRPKAAQDIVSRHAELLQTLKAGGLTNAELATLLAEVGVVREDGSPVPEGTISSALCRDRQRGGGPDRAQNAGLGSGPSSTAASRSTMQPDAVERETKHQAASGTKAPQDRTVAGRQTVRAPRLNARPRRRIDPPEPDRTDSIVRSMSGRGHHPREHGGDEITSLGQDVVPPSTLQTALLLNTLRSTKR